MSCQLQLKKDTNQRCVGQRLDASPTQQVSARAVVLFCHVWNSDRPQEEEGEEEGADEDEEQPESTERKEHDTDGQTGEQNVQSDTAVELAGEASERDQAKEVVYTQHLTDMTHYPLIAIHSLDKPTHRCNPSAFPCRNPVKQEHEEPSALTLPGVSSTNNRTLDSSCF